jgi:hypothetical protein
VRRYGNYNWPFIPMIALLPIGAGLWLGFDPTLPPIPQADSVAWDPMRQHQGNGSWPGHPAICVFYFL